jgi:hypothetical protein
LPGDIDACERLANFWLAFRLQTEAVKLEATLVESKRVALAETCRELAMNGVAYAASIAELGTPAGVSYAWTRDLTPAPSEKSVYSQQILARDALYAAPNREDTITHLLTAAGLLVSRWEKILELVSKETGFELPSYVELGKEQGSSLEYTQPLESESVISRELKRLGRKWSELKPAEQDILTRMQMEHMSVFKNPTPLTEDAMA